MSTSRSTVSIDARADIDHHVTHTHDRPGFSSWRLTGTNDVTVYLEGTSQEMRDFAARIILAANLRDAEALTRGEAPPEAVQV